MLASILVALSPSQAAPVLGTLARPLQAWFLQQITLVNPGLGGRLHDNPTGEAAGQANVKPFTVSTLLDERGRPLRPGSWLQPGNEYWARFTSCSRELSETLLERVFTRRNRKLSAHLELYKMPLRLENWTCEPAQHDWAGQSDFTALCSNGYHPPLRQVSLEFASPTAFRSQGADVPLPLPEHVFRSYWLKWNAFAPEALQIEGRWPAFAAACIRVHTLAGLNSEHWRFADGARGGATGFTGAVTFNLLPQHQCGEWSPYWPGAATVMHTLARFAFYCGTGHHTTTGMGQTRLSSLGGPRRQDQAGM